MKRTKGVSLVIELDELYRLYEQNSRHKAHSYILGGSGDMLPKQNSDCLRFILVQSEGKIFIYSQSDQQMTTV